MTTINPAAATLPAGQAKADSTLHKAAQGFEAIFLREIIGVMRKTHLADDFLGSSSTDQFRELADARTAEELSKSGAFGLGAMLERQLAGRKVEL
jgi:peptidoglycan hydrolase FlgJ